MSTLAEIMANRSPSPDYKALVADSSDAYVLAVNLTEPAATEPGGYLVAWEGITEHPNSLNPETSEQKYLHTGSKKTKTGNSPSFSLSGDKFSGDPFQEAILAFEMKYGTGNTVIKDYVYLNTLTGLGEKGKIAIMVEEDTAGGSGDPASFSASLEVQGMPAKYSFTAP